ncbi:microtubule-associated protein 10-like [Asterias rubens]|uniref:microtubule-associated protein 10-like n=1 Tax=Asterias rubens TaxID=7604 RepID=UPI001455D9E5|nr:microtubule-associated protein 10-like [Asterias rubens]
MDSNETLFSLELAVETLRIHSSTVVCRLPSVAFRLLDFPTLLLHHVDPDQVRNIKEKINLGTFGSIPAQLQELKDHRGNFCVNKCKSCLLKMNPETLLAYLRNTPLYVMLIDVWPEVSKLVANCTISLQKTMEEISGDIERNGIDIPSVHGHRDSYKLYNLMGSEVGWIVLRYRLLSMGVSLMPHIPDTAITRRRTEHVDLAITPRKTNTDVVTTVSVEDASTKIKEKDVILEDLEVEGQTKKTISIAVSTADHSPDFQSEKANQCDQKGTKMANTTKQRHHQHKVERSMPLMQNDDLFVNNTHCPPPLYFNTVNEDSPITSGINIQTLGRNHREIHERGYLNTNNDRKSQVAYNLSEELSTMSSGTCSEEVIHEVETHYTLPSQNPTLSPRWSVRKTHRKSTTENSQIIETSKKHRRDQPDLKQARQVQGSETCNRCQLNLDSRHQSQMPILAALLQELSLLHGNVLQNEPVSRELIQKPPLGKHKPQAEVVSSPKGKENILISKPQSVIQEEKPYRHKHQECTKPPRGVPPTKGWLRQQPVHSKRKTKLHYGMTHSQKLRLKKNNPELLKELEVEEARLRTLQMEKERMTMRDDDDFIDEVSNLNVSTEITHHLEDEKRVDYTPRTESVPEAEETKTSPKKIKRKQMKDQHMRTEVSNTKGRIEEPVVEPKPPLPRPRKLTEGTFVWGDKERHLEDNAGEFPDTQFSSVEPKDLSSSDKSARSIDVYLPTASLQESDIDSQSDDSYSTSYSSSSLNQHPKTIQVPGIPSEDPSQVDVSHAEEVPDVQYSDDFIDSDRFASTGEQELEPLASNKSESYHSAQSTFSSSSSRSSSKSQVPLNPLPSLMPLSNDVATNLQKRRLSIPKPKLSSISPVPVRRTSKTSTLSVNTAATLDPHKDYERSPTPPTPKPRTSLMRSSSLFSEDSRLRSTVPSSEFKTEDSQNADWTNKDESEENYSDDFSDSDHESDQSNTF